MRRSAARYRQETVLVWHTLLSNAHGISSARSAIFDSGESSTQLIAASLNDTPAALAASSERTTSLVEPERESAMTRLPSIMAW